MAPSNTNGYLGILDKRLDITGSEIDNEECKCVCVHNEIELNIDKKQKVLYRVIGDMVYFKDIEKAIPLRKIPIDMRRRLGI